MPWTLKREITIREIILVLGLLAMGVMFYARGEAHIDDHTVHVKNREVLELQVMEMKEDVDYLRKRFDEVHPPER